MAAAYREISTPASQPIKLLRSPLARPGSSRDIPLAIGDDEDTGVQPVVDQAPAQPALTATAPASSSGNRQPKPTRGIKRAASPAGETDRNKAAIRPSKMSPRSIYARYGMAPPPPPSAQQPSQQQYRCSTAPGAATWANVSRFPARAPPVPPQASSRPTTTIPEVQVNFTNDAGALPATQRPMVMQGQRVEQVEDGRMNVEQLDSILAAYQQYQHLTDEEMFGVGYTPPQLTASQWGGIVRAIRGDV